MRLALAVLLAPSLAAADPGELGTSSRGRTFWPEPPAPTVTPIWAVTRHGRPFVYDWEASVAGVEIDHDRFYELVGRPELARSAKLRRALGVLAIVGGAAIAAFGADEVVHDHALGLVPYFGGFGVSLAGAYLVLTPDTTSAAEAQELAGRRLVVGLGAKF